MVAATIKLRFAHLGGHNPPIIVIHGNQTSQVPNSYRRYLENEFRKVFKLEGTPIRVEFKQNANPYAGRTNTMTDAQKNVNVEKCKIQKRGKKRWGDVKIGVLRGWVNGTEDVRLSIGVKRIIAIPFLLVLFICLCDLYLVDLTQTGTIWNQIGQ